MINSTSFSRLQVFEECKFRAKLQYIDRIPDPKPKVAADRGTMIHQLGEDFACGKLNEFPNELRHFSDEFYQLRALYPTGCVELEGDWGFDKNWKPVPWNQAWLRMKIDALIFMDHDEALVVDYKTGKKFGNEIKHGDQCLNYAAAVVAKHPEIQLVHTELWYLDQNELTYNRYTKSKCEAALARYDKRHKAVTEATRFPPNPNIHSCKWCPYKPEPAGTGHCSVGVIE